MISGLNNTQDKIFLFSIAEACNPAYGFNSEFRTESETRVGANTEYAKERGAYTDDDSPTTGNGVWWLHSPGDDSNSATIVFGGGYGYDDGKGVFKGIKKNATFKVPKKYYKKLAKLIEIS